MPAKTAAQMKKQKEKDRKRRQKELESIQAEHEAHGDPEQRKKAEQAAVDASLAKIGRAAVHVPGDGDCLFSALAHQRQLFAKQELMPAKEVRRLLASYILEHKDQFEPFLLFVDDDDEDMEDGVGDKSSRVVSYCQGVEGTQWGTLVEVRAAAELFGARIAVVDESTVHYFNPKGVDFSAVEASDWCLIYQKYLYTLGAHFNATAAVTSVA